MRRCLGPRIEQIEFRRILVHAELAQRDGERQLGARAVGMRSRVHGPIQRRGNAHALLVGSAEDARGQQREDSDMRQHGRHPAAAYVHHVVYNGQPHGGRKVEQQQIELPRRRHARESQRPHDAARLGILPRESENDGHHDHRGQRRNACVTVAQPLQNRPLVGLRMQHHQQIEIIHREDRSPRISQKRVIDIAYRHLQRCAH